MADMNDQYTELPLPDLLELLQRKLSSRSADGDPTEDVLNYSPRAATKTDITDMLRKLNDGEYPRGVSEEYLDILRISDGLPFQLKESEDVDLESYLFRAKHVEREDHAIDLHLFKANPLVHPLPKAINDKFDWPRISGITIGAAGDEGELWLIGPEDLDACRKEFHKTYNELPSEDKQRTDEQVSALYGDTRKMEEQEWTILEFYHWSPDVKLHLSIRDYLISVIQSLEEQ